LFWFEIGFGFGRLILDIRVEGWCLKFEVVCREEEEGRLMRGDVRGVGRMF